MERPPYAHRKPHIATGVDAEPRPSASGDIGRVAAASAPLRPSPTSMPAASPYLTNPLRIASPQYRRNTAAWSNSCLEQGMNSRCSGRLESDGLPRRRLEVKAMKYGF